MSNSALLDLLALLKNVWFYIWFEFTLCQPPISMLYAACFGHTLFSLQPLFKEQSVLFLQLHGFSWFIAVLALNLSMYDFADVWHATVA